jgi:mono/diheme cytochrome c family protein
MGSRRTADRAGLILLLSLAGCPKSEGSARTIPQESRDVFADRCATCHGLGGKGNGPASQTLNPKPRDYTDAEWQKSTTDDKLREIIVKGGAALGKSEFMPANQDLAGKPEVVDGLVGIIRSFGRGKH